MLKDISNENKEKETKIHEEIFRCIDNKENLLFNSGAGAGKTYALVESLKYIIKNYNKELKYNNQKIICITYTNVATNEVKERLGNSSIVLVSTIHERIWNLIKKYQKELVEIHKNNIKQEIKKIKNEIYIKKEYSLYKSLDEDDRKDFEKLIIKNKELYYKYYNLKSDEFKKILESKLNKFFYMLKNVNNFKKIVNSIFRLSDYLICLKNIDENKTSYRSISYDSRSSVDKLHKMKISHDTLLKYGFEIVEKHDLLKQIIIDKYPFILIDEYQDTNEYVIKIMSCLYNYSKEINHKIFIAYFGDSAQNIYSDGVGRKIKDYHKNLQDIQKKFNRRSTKEIIEVSNKIRNDEIKQISIFNDCSGGKVKFYSGDLSHVDKFIDDYSKKWLSNSKKPLHCLMLTNKNIAKYSGFEGFYNNLSKCKAYKGIKYNQLNTELLSNDKLKLGKIQNLIYRIVDFNFKIKKNDTQLIDILPIEIIKILNFNKLKNLILLLKSIDGDTLKEYIENISIMYSEDIEGYYKKIIDYILNIDEKNISLEIFKNYLVKNLFPNIQDNEIDLKDSIISSILNTSMKEYLSWYKYISNLSDNKIIYHTYHGTKGLEFEDVVIILGKSFGIEKRYFDFFFENYNKIDELDDLEKNKYERIRNLLYVSVTRAIKNLRILYIDDISNFSDNLSNIFGEIYYLR
ncbi:UvrD-helicase domain-containing protein [Clostridium perfringens]